MGAAVRRSSARLGPALLAALALVACRDPGLISADDEWGLGSTSIHFGRVPRGAVSTRSVEVDNRSKRALALTASTAAPFSTAATVAVPGGSSLWLDVALSSEELGPVRGELGLSSSGRTLTVTLDAEVIDVTCAATSACRVARFDPLILSCVEDVAANGSPCADACLDAASCQGGVCVGNARRCDDGDACTVDSCAPAIGCLHEARQCPGDGNACHVAVCSPQTGCGIDLAGDGTACGAADCSTAEICLAGACRVATVPDGTSCASDSPCQGPGICQQKRCVLPPPTTLVPRWEYSPASGYLSFTGVSDVTGSLYWIESATDGGTELVSVDRDGQPRFRQPMLSYGISSAFLSGSLFIASAIGSSPTRLLGQLTAYRASDGARLWSTALFPDYFSAQDVPGGDGANAVFMPQRMADNGQGQIYLSVIISVGGGSQVRTFLVLFDAATGGLVWKKQVTGALAGPISDLAGNAYFGEGVAGAPFPTVSLAPDGTQRWSAAAGYAYQHAVIGGWLVTSSQMIDLSTGQVWGFSNYGYSVVGSPSTLFRSASLSSTYIVERRDASNGNVVWRGGPNFGAPLDAPVLTSRDSVIGLVRSSQTTEALVEVLGDGGTGFYCPLPAVVSSSHWYDWSSLSLATERVVVAEVQPSKLSAFEVKRSLAAQGWVCGSGGTPGRQNRPR
jgi:hypothetical protein